MTDQRRDRPGIPVDFPNSEVDISIAARFERVARLHPDRLAVNTGDRALTYDELNRAANRIAHGILEKRGPGSEPIALLFEPGLDIIAAIFGVLKAGKFLVALDPASPEQRNLRALEESGAPLIVTELRRKRLADTLGQRRSAILAIDALDNTYRANPVHRNAAADSAALTYTSGSTGEPKGVLQTHQHFLHSCQIQTDEMRITIDDRVSLLHSLSFATAYGNLFATLLCGAALFPLDTKSLSAADLARWVADQKLTVIHLPPTLFREFAESMAGKPHLHQLRLIRLSGAPITRLDFELYKSCFPASTLLNITMGSTEIRGICSAVLDAAYSFPPEGSPVGYARPGKEIFIVDELGREVANGLIGEIAVRSKYVDAEYWQQDRQDGRPTPQLNQDRMSLTGDLGKKLDDGFVIHMGRQDFMVKIRGYRVEIAEIESALRVLPQLKDAAVAPVARQNGDNFLAAYVVCRPETEPTHSELRRRLKETLPDYMIPATFIFLDALPMTNGKIDRKALPAPGRSRPQLEAPFAAPRSRVESQLASIWAEALFLDEVGIHDNFFALGGHSLAASRVISRVSQTFKLDVPLKALLDAPTIAQMAKLIAHAGDPIALTELDRLLSEIEAMPEEEARKQVREKNLGGKT